MKEMHRRQQILGPRSRLLLDPPYSVHSKTSDLCVFPPVLSFSVISRANALAKAPELYSRVILWRKWKLFWPCDAGSDRLGKLTSTELFKQCFRRKQFYKVAIA